MPNYESMPSPNKSSRNGQSPSGIIVHNTAGGDLLATAQYLCNQTLVGKLDPTSGMVIGPKGNQINFDSKSMVNDTAGNVYYNAKASAHMITGRDGRTIQLVTDEESAWHAGSYLTVPKLNGKDKLNGWTLGHEICNWGGLLKKDDKFYCWPGGYTTPYKGPTPYYHPLECIPPKTGSAYRVGGVLSGALLFPQGIIEYWEPYTEEQIKATITLYKEWVAHWDIGKNWIVGHDQVNPEEKIDPGPAFPWASVMDNVWPQTSNVVANASNDSNVSNGNAIINAKETSQSDNYLTHEDICQMQPRDKQAGLLTRVKNRIF